MRQKMKKLTILLLAAVVLVSVCAGTISGLADGLEPSATINAKSVAFQDSIYLLFYATFENVPQDAETGVLVWKDAAKAQDGSIDVSYATVCEFTNVVNPTYGSEYAYKNIAAKNMTDDLYARSYVKDGENYTFSPVETYSLLQYANNRLAGSDDENFKSLLRAMLNYGAAAQTYFEYKTEYLANASFNSSAAVNDPLSAGLLGSAPASTAIKAKNVAFQDSIYLLFYATFDNVPQDAETGVFVWNDFTKAQDGAIDVSYATACECTGFVEPAYGAEYAYRNLAAKNMTDDLYVRSYIKDGENYTFSPVVKYSILQYAYNRLAKSSDEKFNALLRAMLEYGAAAQTYFNYRTDRLANAEYVTVSLVNGTFPDGKTTGLFQAGDSVAIQADAIDGWSFSSWQNSSEAVIGNTESYELQVTGNETYTADYSWAASAKVILTGENPSAEELGAAVMTLGDTFINKKYYTLATTASGDVTLEFSLGYISTLAPGKYEFGVKIGVHDLTVSLQIIKHIHALTIHPGFAPTCTSEGSETYYTCDGCGEIFKDEAGTQPTTAEAERIEVNSGNHDWSDKNGICRNNSSHICNHNDTGSGVCPICGKNLSSGGNHEDSYYTPTQTGTYDAGLSGAVIGTWSYDGPTGTWSFILPSGEQAKGWVKAVNPYATGNQPKVSWFYFDENGVMLTGWQWLPNNKGVIRAFYLNDTDLTMLGACWLDGNTSDELDIDKEGAWNGDGTVNHR